MVLLTITPATAAAIEQYEVISSSTLSPAEGTGLSQLLSLEPGAPVEHEDLIELSSYLTRHSTNNGSDAQKWRLDVLLRGAKVHRAPPQPKPKPTPEYKALMQRLRHEEDQRQYERMINPQPEHQSITHLGKGYSFNAATSIGQGPDIAEIDEVTFADVNRQMALIINVLVSIIACSVAIWMAARRWSVPQRLGLSMSGSFLVAAAEVAIYMGYIRRVSEAKDKEKKVVETKEVVQSWVLDGTSAEQKTNEASNGIRYRKGKHR